MDWVTNEFFFEKAKETMEERQNERMEAVDEVRFDDLEREKPMTSEEAVGNLFVIKTKIPALVEWLVVRQHPDDDSLVLLAPVDSFPLVGRCDFELNPNRKTSPNVVRCSQAIWASFHICQHQVDVVSDEMIKKTRTSLASLARGVVPKEEPGYIEWITLRSNPNVGWLIDDDPEYIKWMETLEKMGEEIANAT